MKILKEGTPATAVISCPHCKCEMEYCNKDLYKTPVGVDMTCLRLVPGSHLRGIGCPKCSASKGELFVEKVLKDLNIPYKS